MARYRVLEPISYVKDGKIVQISKPTKDGYELPDDAVAALGESVELIVEALEETTAVEGATGTVLDGIQSTTVAPPAPETTTAESTSETTEKADDTTSTTSTDAAPGGRVRNGKRDSG